MTVDHLSHSSLALFNRCSRAWWFKYMIQAPSVATPSLVLGTAFHNAIERAVKSYHLGDPTQGGSIDGIWSAAWAEAIERGPVAWGDELPEQVSNEGYRLFASQPTRDVIAQLKPFVDDDGPLIERRIEIHVPGIPVPVIGFIDMVGADGVPIDFKTSKRAWTQEQAQTEVQPLYYHIGLNQAGFKGNPDYRFKHVVFVKSRTPQVQIIETRHSLGDLFWLMGMIREAWASIEARVFVPNPGACMAYGRRCDFYGQCWGRA